MSLQLRMLTENLGAEVLGLDLTSELAPDIREDIQHAWDRHGVLLFRDQSLSADDQRRFTRYFGDFQSPFGGARKGRDTLFVGNVVAPDGLPGDIALGEMSFHQDGCYSERPTKQTFLYALEIPAAGGNTKFASTARAYANLPADLRAELAAYDIHFTFHYSSVVRTEITKTGPNYTHPLVIAHHRTGEPLLFCNPLMADRIIGREPDESRALIERLCAELERADNVYEHVWRVGDLIMWDNLATVHARTDFDPTARRLLRRTTTMGERPLAYREQLLATEA
jgi:taurine dioxygenase